MKFTKLELALLTTVGLSTLALCPWIEQVLFTLYRSLGL